MTKKHKLLFVIWLITSVLRGTALAQSTEPVTYTLKFPAPHTHYVSVEASVPTDGAPQVELMMAVWTPGSYLVREFARHVEGVTARTATGATLAVEKSRKNRWRVSTSRADRILVSYRVHGREMSVRTNWIGADFAILNGAPTFLTLADDVTVRPHEVTLELPTGWSRSLTGLTPLAEHGPHAYRATDFDTLVDSPIVVGNPAVYEFVVGGRPHLLVNLGESGVWDGPRSVRDVEEITRELQRMWGVMPYERYLFLNMITEAGGGLEHHNSTLLMTSRWATASRGSYLRWLGLVSHELFHAWNIKRLRPIELGPFDYEREVYTDSLWVVEGLTSYYGDLAVHRAGLSTAGEYLESLSRQIRGLQTTPGRNVQPLALASYDAWIKYYRADENSQNSSVSYYTKGAVLGFLLDLRIRIATRGTKSLDDLMRLAYERFSGDRGFTQTEFRITAQEVAGVDLSEWFIRALDTTEELDYTEALSWLGLEFADRSETEDLGWIGLSTRTSNGRLLVSQVPNDTPAFNAGFNVNDEILAIGDHRVLADEWSGRIASTPPGSEISIMISRRGALRNLPIAVGSQPTERWELQPVEEASSAQKQHLEAWLSGR